MPDGVPDGVGVVAGVPLAPAVIVARELLTVAVAQAGVKPLPFMPAVPDETVLAVTVLILCGVPEVAVPKFG